MAASEFSWRRITLRGEYNETSWSWTSQIVDMSLMADKTFSLKSDYLPIAETFQ